jgi:hypothetical protein
MIKNSVTTDKYHVTLSLQKLPFIQRRLFSSADHPGLLHASLVQPAHPPQRPRPRPSAREGDNFFFAKYLIKGILSLDSRPTRMAFVLLHIEAESSDSSKP